ncbi:E3 ubiquitin-protein ligase RNF25 isoform X1 [Mobula birostris]|uniref:E3 ubiquitin-protein ligase RNF25 isoform X1 n=1 Tax=Mobula birostris TaxID=1983395 RepID=UPI003B28B3E4
MAEEGEEGDLGSELEILRSIYLDELKISHDSNRQHPWELSITLHPATADVTESQYVCLTLGLSLTAQYPDIAPSISIWNPRGLSDDRILSIRRELEEEAEAGRGGQVLYQLIEKGKEILTNNNVPFGHCVICLNCFQESDDFTRTSCYHHFHSYCLASYIQHVQAELRMQGSPLPSSKPPNTQTQVGVLCPVCREPLTYNLGLLSSAADPSHPLEPYQPDETWVKRWQELQRIYRRQKERGGIIDPQADRDRFLVSLTRPLDVMAREVERKETTATPSPAGPPPQQTDPRAPHPQGSRPFRRPRPARRGHHGTRAPSETQGVRQENEEEVETSAEASHTSRLTKPQQETEIEKSPPQARGPWPRMEGGAHPRVGRGRIGWGRGWGRGRGWPGKGCPLPQDPADPQPGEAPREGH